MTIWCEEGMIHPGEVLVMAKWVNANDDATVLETIRRMTELSNHPYFIHTHCGGIRSFDSIEEFYVALQKEEIKTASVEKKRELTAIRRNQFRAIRPELELALIERDQYVCAHPKCNNTTEITIDHIVPLSKGGTDELDNLCFLCTQHNSAKGDK